MGLHVQHWTRDMEKQLNHRIEIVMGNPKMKAVYDKFGWRAFRRSSVVHGLEKLLADNKIRGRRCYEIGTWNGLTAAVLSQFFKEVVTVDIVHNPEKHQILDFLGIKNVRCIDLQRNYAKNVDGLEIDCAFLDGDHAADTEDDFDLVKHCGRVIFHEVWPWQSPVWDLVNSLPKEEVTRGGFCFALWQRGNK